MKEITRSFLKEHSEQQYKEFSKSLTPGSMDMLGVRLPILRKKARELSKGDWRAELETEDLYFEEVMLRGMMLSYVRESMDEMLPYIKEFIPKVDNWSVCDSVFSKMDVLREDREKTWKFIQPYLYSDLEFEVRVAIIIMMQHLLKYDGSGKNRQRRRTIGLEDCGKATENAGVFLNRIFHALDREFLQYYASMAAAWTIAEAFCCYPKETMDFLKDNHLDDKTYNRTLQKIVESLIPQPEVKAQIKSMKRKNKT